MSEAACRPDLFFPAPPNAHRPANVMRRCPLGLRQCTATTICRDYARDNHGRAVGRRGEDDATPPGTA